MSVVLVRHGETDLAGTFCGQLDPPLNERGRRQAAALAQELAANRVAADRIAAIYTSDLRRARETAEAIGEAIGVPVEVCEGLREIGFGAWEGLRWAEIEAQDPIRAADWLAAFPALPAPGGESVEAFEARVLTAVERMLDTEKRPFALVSHGGVMRAVLRRMCGWPEQDSWEQTRDYASVVRLATLRPKPVLPDGPPARGAVTS